MNMKADDAGARIAGPEAAAKDAHPKKLGRKSSHNGYRDNAPDLKESGVGKDYRGYRIFYTAKNGTFEHIDNGYYTRPATRDEIAQFKMDLRRAAATDTRMARYILTHMNLQPLVETAAPLKEPIAPSGGPGAPLAEPIVSSAGPAASGPAASEPPHPQQP